MHKLGVIKCYKSNFNWKMLAILKYLSAILELFLFFSLFHSEQFTSMYFKHVALLHFLLDFQVNESISIKKFDDFKYFKNL